MPRMVHCPVCQRTGPWLENNPWYPFCSERCKMVDLGKWLGGEYRIASPLTVEDLEELADIDETEEEK